jgi:hypothetical protein
VSLACGGLLLSGLGISGLGRRLCHSLLMVARHAWSLELMIDSGYFMEEQFVRMDELFPFGEQV